MKHRPYRAFIAAMAFLLAAGATGVWTWQGKNSADPLKRVEESFPQHTTHKRELRPPSNRDASRRTRIGTEKFIASLKAEYPALDVDGRAVPDAENGFLQIFLLGNPPNHSGLEISDTLKSMLQGDGAWDAGAAREALAENAVLVEKIESIAAMKDRSSMPAEYQGFIGARAGKYAADILLLKARLAAEAGDEPEALRLVRGAFNIGDHHRNLETGSLLTETIALLIDLSTRRAVIKTILPALGPTADTEAWKASMPVSQYSSANFAKVLRGEWETTARHHLFPLILDPSNREAPNDGEALARAHAADYSALVTEMKSMDFHQLGQLGKRDSGKFYASLSSESREISEAFSIGITSWTKGYARADTLVTQHDVALDLLILEKSGIPLEASSADRLVPDPSSGAAFRFDPATRTLSAPDGTKDIDPIILPGGVFVR